MESAFGGIPEGRNVRIDGMAGFVSGDVQSHHARAAESLHKLGGEEALLLAVMAESAKDQAGFDAGRADRVFGGLIDGFDHGLGSQSTLEVEKRGEAQLSVDDAVSRELFENIFGDEAQRFFALHQLEAARGPGEEVSKRGALRRGDEFSVVLLARDGGIELRDGVIAKGAVEVQVEFDFGQHPSGYQRSAFRSPGPERRTCLLPPVSCLPNRPITDH